MCAVLEQKSFDLANLDVPYLLRRRDSSTSESDDPERAASAYAFVEQRQQLESPLA